MSYYFHNYCDLIEDFFSQSCIIISSSTHPCTAVVEQVHEGGFASANTSMDIQSLRSIALLLSPRKESQEAAKITLHWTIPLNVVVDRLQGLGDERLMVICLKGAVLYSSREFVDGTVIRFVRRGLKWNINRKLSIRRCRRLLSNEVVEGTRSKYCTKRKKFRKNWHPEITNYSKITILDATAE